MTLTIEIRTGIHTSEIELRGAGIGPAPKSRVRVSCLL